MRIEKCWFCSSNIYPGHGIVFVRNDAKTFRFCRSKCHKHFKAKHNPRKMKWTKAYRKSVGKEMLIDSTFAFEKRRNCPVKYDRDVMIKTVRAIQKTDAIKEARKERFYKQRMLRAHLKQMPLARKEIVKHQVLLHGPEVPHRETEQHVDTMEYLAEEAHKLVDKVKIRETKFATEDTKMDETIETPVVRRAKSISKKRK